MTIRSISNLLNDFKSDLPKGQVSLDHVLLAFHERGFGFALFIFALPMAMPIPVPPGVNVLLASPLIVLTLQLAIGRSTIWMPKSWRSKALQKKSIESMIDAALPFVQKMEYLVKPRFALITQGIASNIIGVLGLIMALTICIPLPLTNTVPSMGIALMALGLIMRDGVFVLLGALIGTAWVALLGFAALTYGPEGLEILKDAIKSFLQEAV